jgi:hypothetical protein
LSDAYAEVHGNGVHISFHHSTKQIEFFSWIKAFLAERGYCSSKISKVTKQVAKKDGRIYYSTKFHTFTFKSFEFIRQQFYVENTKIVPLNIEDY